MSGAVEAEDIPEDAGNISDWIYAHILWQKRGLRMEEFAAMPRNVQLAYIASEQLAMDSPLDASDRLAKVYIKPK